MRCPKCGNQEDKVIDSRSGKDGAVIRRRRECIACEHRYTTYEEIENVDLRVVKRNGLFEKFDRKKIINGILKSCEKRPVSLDAIEKTTDKIIDRLEREFGLEIPTTAIGEAIMTSLRSLDEISYVRFASVYRNFRDINEFVNEVQNLKVD